MQGAAELTQSCGGTLNYIARRKKQNSYEQLIKFVGHMPQYPLVPLPMTACMSMCKFSYICMYSYETLWPA